MRNQNSITHSEYTLKKTKEYILKNVDIIKIRYDLIYLYEEDIDDFIRIKYNQQLIDYILNDSINFYQIEKNVIINKNMIEYASIDAIAAGYCDVDFFNWCLEISMPSETFKLIYDDSRESYDFLENIRKKIYPDKKIKFRIFKKIFYILILIVIIKLFLLHIKLF